MFNVVSPRYFWCCQNTQVMVAVNWLEYELVDANRVCPGIHKVRVGPAARSAVPTWLINYITLCGTIFFPYQKCIITRNNFSPTTSVIKQSCFNWALLCNLVAIRKQNIKTNIYFVFSCWQPWGSSVTNKGTVHDKRSSGLSFVKLLVTSRRKLLRDTLVTNLFSLLFEKYWSCDRYGK